MSDHDESEPPPFPNDRIPARACLLQSTERTRCYGWLSAADGDLYLERWTFDRVEGWVREAIRWPRSAVGSLELLIAGAANVRAAGPNVVNPSYSVDDAQRLIGDLEAIVRSAVAIGGIKLALDLVVNFVARFLIEARVHEDQVIGAIRKSVTLLSSMAKN